MEIVREKPPLNTPMRTFQVGKEPTDADVMRTAELHTPKYSAAYVYQVGAGPWYVAFEGEA